MFINLQCTGNTFNMKHISILIYKLTILDNLFHSPTSYNHPNPSTKFIQNAIIDVTSSSILRIFTLGFGFFHLVLVTSIPASELSDVKWEICREVHSSFFFEIFPEQIGRQGFLCKKPVVLDWKMHVCVRFANLPPSKHKRRTCSVMSCSTFSSSWLYFYDIYIYIIQSGILLNYPVCSCFSYTFKIFKV